MKTGTENYRKVEELSLGNIGVICNINKPKYTINVKRVINSGWEYKKVDNRNLYGGGA